MIPLRDNIPSRTTPIVCYAIIGLCSVVFYFQLHDASIAERYGMIPARITNPDAKVTIRQPVFVRTPRGIEERTEKRPAEPAAVPPWATLLTCVFLHGGWLHIIGNLWFLFVFGDNVEDRFGHFGFLALYLGCGVASSLAQWASVPDSMVPTIGASGAIAGAMGAYFALYPKAQVLAVIPIFIFPFLVVLPAPVFLGFWFLIQFFQGTVAIHAVEQTGVAWWAHIGGFALGALLAWLLSLTKVLRPPVENVRTYGDGARYYRMRFR